MLNYYVTMFQIIASIVQSIEYGILSRTFSTETAFLKMYSLDNERESRPKAHFTFDWQTSLDINENTLTVILVILSAFLFTGYGVNPLGNTQEKLYFTLKFLLVS